jgi:hypothetical protein
MAYVRNVALQYLTTPAFEVMSGNYRFPIYAAYYFQPTKSATISATVCSLLLAAYYEQPTICGLLYAAYYICHYSCYYI